MGISSAQAADLPVEAPAPLPAPMVYDWNGFYLGGHLGYGWGDADVSTCSIGIVLCGSGTLDPEGFLGGVQAGYWWQTGGSFVFGVDGSWSWTGMDDSKFLSLPGIGVPVTYTAAAKIDSIAMVQARLGWATGRWLFFGQGGYGGVKSSGIASALGGIVGAGVTAADNNWHHGWTIGLGTAVKVSPSFSIGAEYNYIDAGDGDYNWTGFGTAGISAVDHNISVFKVTGNYHFNLFGGM